MKIVMENSERDIRRHEIEDELKRALRQVAGNTLRIVRGAGKPENLAAQMANVVRLCEAYHAEVGHYPPAPIYTDALSPRATMSENRPWIDEGRVVDEIEDATEFVIRSPPIPRRSVRDGSSQPPSLSGG